MDEDATWYRSRPQPRQHCVRRDPVPPRRNGHSSPSLFSAHVYCGHGRPSQLLLSSCKCESHDYIAVTHNCNCNRLSSSSDARIHWPNHIKTDHNFQKTKILFQKVRNLHWTNACCKMTLHQCIVVLSSSSDGRPFGCNRHRPRRRGCDAPFGGSWVPI